MYKISLIIIGLSFSSILFAQKNAQDVVYLKNGSIIRGFISEFIPDKSVTIKTADQNIFVFEIAEVEKITREEPPNSKKDWTPYIRGKGYFNETELRLLIGKGEPVTSRER